MKILFCVRHNFYSSQGGVVVQILKTKEYLERLGVCCDLTTTALGVDYSKYDIVHLTDLTWVYDNIVYLRELKNFRGKKVLSTIYWPFDDYASNGAPLIQKLVFRALGINGLEYAKTIAKYIVQKDAVYIEGLKKSYLRNQKEIVDSVDWLLPNSRMEIDALNHRLGLRKDNFTVVNNAIDTAAFDAIVKNALVEKQDNSITFVARIDPRKNQLNFLEAIKETPYKVKFIGNTINHRRYYERLRRVAEKRGNVEFISQISQDEVFKHMLGAKVNVLTSWIETPGLVSIEAGYAGCNLVVTDKGSVRDYFRDYAFYCMPDDVSSIRSKTIMAMESEFNEDLRSLIGEQYTWEKAAEQTLGCYQRLLGI
jgi:glycosyltransferase involved in cell wall biosynthesis